MVFEFTPNKQFNFMAAFAGRVGATRQDDTLFLPSALGVGSIRRVRLAPAFSLLIHQYVLHEELILRRTVTDRSDDRVTVLVQLDDWAESQSREGTTTRRRADYSLRITSPKISSELCFPAGAPILFAVLSMSRFALHDLLRLKTMNGVVEQILLGSQEFLFEETLNADTQNTLRTLVTINPQSALGELRIWIQVQTLLGWLFERLLTRETSRPRPVHRHDAEQLDRVRTAIVADWRVPPQLTQLATLAGMSVSKLTELYKQVYGDSIYNYFQKARMTEAGYLLKQGGYSVSETGYRLGFSNLSHFSRLFEKHYGLTPKRFSTTP